LEKKGDRTVSSRPGTFTHGSDRLRLDWTEKVCGRVPCHSHGASALCREDCCLGRKEYWCRVGVECYKEDFPVAAVIAVGSRGDRCDA